MPSKWRARVRLAALSVCAAGLMQAGPPLTTIQDTLYKADGTRFDGTAQIEWKSFRAYDGSEVPQQILNVRVVSGALRLSLVPTTNATPGTRYTVRFNADGRTQFVEYWSVPPSVVPMKLRDVRVSLPLSGDVTDPGTVQNVTITDIPGLRAELDIRPSKGTAFVPSRAVIINSTGVLESAAGNTGDCLRIDGTASPCGTGGLQFVDGESPAGAVNGANRIFQLSAAPAPASSLLLYRNGIALLQAVDYSLNGSSVTLVAAQTPLAGERLQAWYRLTPTGTPTIEFTDGEIPAGVINGTNSTFTIAGTPMPASSLRVFRNGLLQASGVDYVVSVNVITFLPASVPGPGDILQVSYRR